MKTLLWIMKYVLKFLEHWIEYIASGSERNALRDGYHFRMRYPKQYKSEKTGIVKNLKRIIIIVLNGILLDYSH